MTKSSDFMLFTIFVIVGIFIIHFSGILNTNFWETLKIASYVFIIGSALTFIKILVEKFEKSWDKKFQ